MSRILTASQLVAGHVLPPVPSIHGWRVGSAPRGTADPVVMRPEPGRA